MPNEFRVLLSAAAAVLALGELPGSPLFALSSTTRTVYVTALDGQGQPVRGLTAADFAVQEGGKDREIVSVEPARARMRIALAIDEPLMASSEIRQGMLNLIRKLAPQAEISVIVIGLSNRVVVPYTSDVATHLAALRTAPQVLRMPTDVGEGIKEIARQFDKEETERPVMVVIAVDGQKEIFERPGDVLGSIRDSRTQLHVVAVSLPGIIGLTPTQILDRSGLSTILTEGPRQSGGRNIGVSAVSAVAGALGQIATELASQYVLTYTLPEGVKPAERLAVSTKKRGVTLRAPTRVRID
jgi:hypothetical protein